MFFLYVAQQITRRKSNDKGICVFGSHGVLKVLFLEAWDN
jgi:hypothetical protein